jgi:hypothetical protein
MSHSNIVKGAFFCGMISGFSASLILISKWYSPIRLIDFSAVALLIGYYYIACLSGLLYLISKSRLNKKIHIPIRIILSLIVTIAMNLIIILIFRTVETIAYNLLFVLVPFSLFSCCIWEVISFYHPRPIIETAILFLLSFGFLECFFFCANLEPSHIALLCYSATFTIFYLIGSITALKMFSH